METEKNLTAQAESGAREKAEKPAPQKESPAAAKPADSSAPAVAEQPADLAAAYQKLLEEKRQLYDRLLRKQAELENFRKRVQREKGDFLEHAAADLIRALLPVLDAFERAMKHRDAAVPVRFYEGMELIHRQLLDVLGRAGLTPVETSGKVFDPHLHQAVETVEAEGYRDQEIVEELQRGYRLKHRLLRPAIVKVAVRPRRELTELQPGDAKGPAD